MVRESKAKLFCVCFTLLSGKWKWRGLTEVACAIVVFLSKAGVDAPRTEGR